VTEVCLAVGGSDTCTGAGVQADLATFQALGVQGCCAITALTAQNPSSIRSVLPTNLTHFRDELEAIFDYYEVCVVKTGMLVGAGHINVLLSVLKEYHNGKPLVVDPVLVASSGRHLLDEAGLNAIHHLCNVATLVTPNIPEIDVFLSLSNGDHKRAAQVMAQKWQSHVLLKGGHESAQKLKDMLCSPAGEIEYFIHDNLYLMPYGGHGTGCRLASAIAAFVMQKKTLSFAVRGAVNWLHNELLKISVDEFLGGLHAK